MAQTELTIMIYDLRRKLLVITNHGTQLLAERREAASKASPA